MVLLSIMRNLVPLKFISHLLLLVILIGTVHGVHECAHAMQGCMVAADDAAVPSAASASSHPSPCTPPPDHQDYDGCDTCVNCACHAPLAVQHGMPCYDPPIFTVRFAEPFTYLPDVFLPKFIPPQNLA